MARVGGNPPRSAPGKLIAVARRWADDGAPDDDEYEEDAADFGLAGEIVVARRQPVPIWPENLETVDVFFALESQWRPRGGIERSAIWSTLKLMAVPKPRRRRCFEDLLVMERAALRVFASADGEAPEGANGDGDDD